MRFLKWANKPIIAEDGKTVLDLQKDIKILKAEIANLEKEACHWKKLALEFRRVHN